MFHSSEIKSK